MVKVRFNDQPIQIRVQGAALVTHQSALAQAAASLAQDAADFAEGFTGPVYASVEDGEAATTPGQIFRVSNGDGPPETTTAYRRTSGGSVVQAPLATTAALASTDPGKGADIPAYSRLSVSDPATRTTRQKLTDVADLRDWNGLDLTGSHDNTAIFEAALQEVQQGRLNVPNGTMMVGNIGRLQYAGLQIIGESKWKTIIKAVPEMAGSIFYNSAAGTAGHIKIANLFIDLDGQDITGIDLNNVNNSLIEQVYIKGGPNKAAAAGRGIVFRSTLASGAYTNLALNCKVENLASGIAWDDDGNENAQQSCEAINCLVGFDMLPSTTTVDTPMLYGGRAEGCDIGLRTGAICPGIFGTRFEASTIADVEFHSGSERPVFYGCYSASSAAIFKDIANTNGLISKGGRFPYYELEQSVSRPIYNVGRQVFAKAGAGVPTVHPQSDYSAYFYDYALIRSQVGLEFANAANTSRIIGLTTNASDEVFLSGYNRGTSSYGNVVVGSGAAVRPNGNNVTDLGTSSQQYKNLLIAGEVRVAGNKVLGSRQAAIPNHASDATVNAILTALRAHGLIAT